MSKQPKAAILIRNDIWLNGWIQEYEAEMFVTNGKYEKQHRQYFGNAVAIDADGKQTYVCMEDGKEKRKEILSNFNRAAGQHGRQLTARDFAAFNVYFETDRNDPQSILDFRTVAGKFIQYMSEWAAMQKRVCAITCHFDQYTGSGFETGAMHAHVLYEKFNEYEKNVPQEYLRMMLYDYLSVSEKADII